MAAVVLALNDMAPAMVSILSGAHAPPAPVRRGITLDVSAAGELINVQAGRTIKIVTAKAVEWLLPEQLEDLLSHAAAIAIAHAKWMKLYPKREQLFQFMQRRVNGRIEQLALSIDKPLNGVISLLLSFGLEPDDHFVALRALVAAPTPGGRGSGRPS
jgi:hypothetical protein